VEQQGPPKSREGEEKMLYRTTVEKNVQIEDRIVCMSVCTLVKK
jgi:hypothetical protein